MVPRAIAKSKTRGGRERESASYSGPPGLTGLTESVRGWERSCRRASGPA